MTSTSNTQQVPKAVETARQKMVREMRERLKRRRKESGQGPYVPPTEVAGPTEVN